MNCPISREFPCLSVSYAPRSYLYCLYAPLVRVLNVKVVRLAGQLVVCVLEQWWRERVLQRRESKMAETRGWWMKSTSLLQPISDDEEKMRNKSLAEENGRRALRVLIEAWTRTSTEWSDSRRAVSMSCTSRYLVSRLNTRFRAARMHSRREDYVCRIKHDMHDTQCFSARTEDVGNAIGFPLPLTSSSSSFSLLNRAITTHSDQYEPAYTKFIY